MARESTLTPAAKRKPDWLKVAIPTGDSCRSMAELLRRRGLHTVCEGARCPNRGECWGASTATFMILGATCTRGCRFCAVSRAPLGEALREGEASDLAEAIAELHLAYAVVTSVDRDDLADRGAGHFAACIAAIKRRNPATRVEVLIPDFVEGEIEAVLAAGPEVLAHNVETVARLQGLRDPRASWEKSLHCLSLAAAPRPDGSKGPVVKTSLMLGLGETREEVLAAMDELREIGCTSLVLGQYLQPTKVQVEVVDYITPEAFEEYGREARKRGFVSVVASPLARTSYHARSSFEAGGRGVEGRAPDDGAERRASAARAAGTAPSTKTLFFAADHKVQGGKLLRVSLEVEGDRVTRVSIAGDFFAHPEEAFEAAEAALVDLPLAALRDRCLEVFSRDGLRLFGASPLDIVAALEKALEAGVRP
jgi:lipoic acid synthetase